LLLISVDFFNGVVDITQRVVVDSCDDRSVGGEVDQPPPSDGVELTHVTKRERTKNEPNVDGA
jgi:hypothetical protein